MLNFLLNLLFLRGPSEEAKWSMSMYIIYFSNSHTITVGGEFGKNKKEYMFLFNFQRLDIPR